MTHSLVMTCNMKNAALLQEGGLKGEAAHTELLAKDMEHVSL